MTDSIGYANHYRKDRDMILFMMQNASLFDIYKNFPTDGGAPGLEFGTVPDNFNQCCELSAELINEEVCRELLPALHKYKANPTLENLVEVADGGVDAIYVVMYMFYALDLPFSKLFAEVHAANMAKLQRGEDGEIKRRADGKILKPEGWKAPEIFEILLEHSNTRAAQRANAVSQEESERRGQELIEQARKTWGG